MAAMLFGHGSPDHPQALQRLLVATHPPWPGIGSEAEACRGTRLTPPLRQQRLLLPSVMKPAGTVAVASAALCAATQQRAGAKRRAARECGTGDIQAPSSPSFGDAFVTPIGPFCPFRSEACAFEGPTGTGMDLLSRSTPQFAMEMAKIQLDAQMGKEPDRERVRQLAEELERSYKQWQVLIAKLRLSDDFQSREYYKLTECHLQRQAKSVEEVGLLVKYQIDCMKAFADGQPPVAPPAGVDLRAPPPGSPSPTAAMFATSFTAQPFTGRERLFESDVVRQEYEALCRDHRQLIKMGEAYGSFDPLGKAAFLDQLEAVEQRWDVFYGRFALQGGLNPEFREQSEAYLASMGLGAGDFRKLVAQAHALMRRDTERDRGLAL